MTTRTSTGVSVVLRGYIAGLTYANNVSDAVNDLDILAGVAADGAGTDYMTLAATITKQSDANWAVGSGVGGLDTGAVGNNDYYIWLIKRPDTGVVDVLYSLSSTAPTMPANYTLKRLIGWFKRVAGTIVAFHTYETEGGGMKLMWDSPTLDVNLANTLTTSRRTDAVKVPLNFSVEALIHAEGFDASASYDIYIYCPDLTDVAPNATAAPLATLGQPTIGQRWIVPLTVQTSAAGLIASRADLATVDAYFVVTAGFKWARRV